MSRLTLRLPETLHRHLKNRSRQEGVSLNQYLVYALTRQMSMSYMVQATPEEERTQQQAAFTALLQSLGQESFGEIEKVMEERESVEPDEGLTPDVVKRLQNRIVANWQHIEETAV